MIERHLPLGQPTLLQPRHNLGRRLAARGGTVQEREPVRAGTAEQLREGVDDRPKQIKPPEHGQCEEIDAGAGVEQHFGDVASPDVAGGVESRLEVAAAPVVSGKDEGRCLSEKALDLLKVAVGRPDELPDEVRVDRIRPILPSGRNACRARASEQRRGRQE